MADYPVWDPRHPNNAMNPDSDLAKKAAENRAAYHASKEHPQSTVPENNTPPVPLNYRSLEDVAKASSQVGPIPQPQISNSEKGIVTQTVENALNQRFLSEMQGLLPSGSSVSWIHGTDEKVVQITHPSLPTPIVKTVDVYNTPLGIVPDVGGRTSLAHVPGDTPGTVYKHSEHIFKEKGIVSDEFNSGIQNFAIAVTTSFSRAALHGTNPNDELDTINAALKESDEETTSSKVSGRMPQSAIDRVRNQVDLRISSSDDPFFKMNHEQVAKAYSGLIYRQQEPGSTKDKLLQSGYIISAGTNNRAVLEPSGYPIMKDGRLQIKGHIPAMIKGKKLTQEYGGQTQLQALEPVKSGGQITGYKEVAPRYITSESDKTGYRYMNVKQAGGRTPVEVEMIVMAATVNSGVSYKFKNQQRNETWGRTDASIRQDLKGFTADDLMQSQINFTPSKGEYGRGSYGIASVVRDGTKIDVAREKSTEEFYPNQGQNYIYIPTHRFGGDFVGAGAPGAEETTEYQKELQLRNPNATVVRMAGITTPQLGIGGTQIVDYRNRGNTGNRKSSDLNVGNTGFVNIGGEDVQISAVDSNIKSPRALESFFGAMTNKQQRNVLGMWSEHDQGSERSQRVLSDFDQQLQDGGDATAIDLEAMASSGGYKGGSVELMQSVFGVAAANKSDPEYQKRLGAAAGVQYIDASPENPKSYEIGFWSQDAYKTMRKDTVTAMMTGEGVTAKQAMRKFKKMYTYGTNARGEQNILTQNIDYPHFAGWAGVSRVGDSPSTGTLNAQLYNAIRQQYPEMADELGIKPDMPFTPNQQASAGILSFLGTENDKRAGRKYKARQLSKEQAKAISALGDEGGYTDYANKVAEITGGSMNEPFEVGGKLFPSGLAVAGKQSEANMEGNEYGPGSKFFNALSATVRESLMTNEDRAYADTRRRKKADGTPVMSRGEYAHERLYQDVSSQGETLMKSLGAAEDARYSWTGSMPSTFGGLMQRFTSAKQANLENRNIARQFGIKASEVRKLRNSNQMRTAVQRQGEDPEIYTEANLNAELASIQNNYNLAPDRMQELRKEVLRHPSKTFESVGAAISGLMDFDGDTRSSEKLVKTIQGKITSFGSGNMRYGRAARDYMYAKLKRDIPSPEVQLELNAGQKGSTEWGEDVMDKILGKVDTVTDPAEASLRGLQAASKGRSASDPYRATQVLQETEKALTGNDPGVSFGQANYGKGIDEFIQSPLGTAYASAAVRADDQGELFFGYNNGQNYEGSDAKKLRKIYANDPGGIRNFLIGQAGEGGLVQDATAPIGGKYYQNAKQMTMMFGRGKQDRAELQSLLEGSDQNQWEGIINNRVLSSYSDAKGELLEGDARKKVDAEWLGTSGVSSLLASAIVKNKEGEVVNRKDEKIRVAGGTRKFMTALSGRGGASVEKLEQIGSTILADRQFRGKEGENAISSSALSLLDPSRREAIALRGGTTSTSDVRAEISDPLTARMLSAMPQLNAVGSQSVENLTPQVTPTPNTPTPQIAPTWSASTPLQVGAPPVWSNGGAWSGEDQKEYLSLERERNSKSRLEISPENSARFAELDLKKKHFSRVEEGGPTSDVSGNFDGGAGSPPIPPSDTPGEEGTAPYGKDKGQKLSYSQAAKLLTNFASFDKSKGKRIRSGMSSYISEVSKASGRDDVDAGNAFDILHSDDVTENQRSFIQKRFGTIAARGAELRQRAMHAIWATKSYPGLRNMSEHEGQIQQLDRYLQSPNQAAMDAGKGFMQLNASLTPADDKQNEYALQGAMRLAENEQVGVLAGALRDAGTDPKKMSQVVQQHGPLMREVGKTVPMLKGANMSVATPEMLQVAEQYKYATGPGGMVAKDFKGGNGETLPYTEQALGKLANVMERVQKNTEKLTEAQLSGDKAAEKRLITEKKKLDFEQEITTAQTQAQAHRVKASSLMDQILSGDTSEETTKKYRSNLDAAQKYEKQAAQVYSDQEEEKVGPYGQAARRLLGGFGLMYAKSVVGFATQNLGYGQDERQRLEAGLSKSAYERMGSVQYASAQQESVQNQIALNGASNNPLISLQQIGAQNPGLRDAGGAMTAFLGTWGYSQFAASTMKGTKTGSFLNNASVGLGIAAVGVSAIADMYSRSQDPNGMAWRMTSGGIPSPLDYSTLGAQVLFDKDGAEDVGRSADIYKGMQDIFENGGKVSDIDNLKKFTPESYKFGAGLMSAITGEQQQSGTWTNLGVTNYEKYDALSKTLLDKNVAPTQDSAAATAAYQLNYAPGISASDPRLKKVAADYAQGGRAEIYAKNMLSIGGSRTSEIYGIDEKTQMSRVGELQAQFAELELSAPQRAALDTGLEFVSKLEGAKYVKGMPGKNGTAQEYTNFYSKFSDLSGTSAGDAFAAEQQAFMNSKRAGLSYSQPDINSYNPAMDTQQSQGIISGATAQNYLATQNMQMGQALYNNAAFYGDNATGKAAYNMMSGAKPGTQTFMNRAMNGDPMALTAMGLGGVNYGNLQLPTIDGGKFDASAFGRMGNTDIGLNGKMTGMQWGSTSLQSSTVFGGTVSAQQNAQNIWGSNNKNFSQAVIGAATNGVKLDQAITMPDGSVIDSIAGTEGIRLQQRNAGFEFTLGNLARQEKSASLDEAYTQKSWKIQDQGRELSNAYQEWQFGFQQKQLDMNRANNNENMGLQKQQTMMQRTYAKEDWAYGDQTRGLQWGWKQEDFAEESRFMTGRSRKKAERQNERDTTMHNLEEDQVEKSKERQQEMWKLEDQRFAIQRKQFEQSMKMQQESLDKNKEYFEARKDLEQSEIKFQREQYKQQLALQKEATAAQKKYTLEQIASQKAMDQLELKTRLTTAASNTLVDGWQTLIQKTMVADEQLKKFAETIKIVGNNANGLTPPSDKMPSDGPLCFTGDMKISMANGSQVRFSDVEVGDKLLSWHEGKVIETEIECIFVHPEKIAKDILVVNGFLRVTPNHPLFINNEWSDASTLKIGDSLLGIDGSAIEVTSIQYEQTEEAVYNLHISHEAHNYFVEGILAHNKRALGGSIFAGERDIVGENGPEEFIPDVNGKIIPNHRLGSNYSNYAEEYTSNLSLVPARSTSQASSPQINIYIGGEEIKDYIINTVQRSLK